MNNSGEKITWTIDLLKEKSTEFKTKTEFQKKYSGGYKAAKKYGILDELFPVENKPIRKSIWTYELVKTKSSECRNVSEFQKKYSGAYKSAQKNDWLDELFPKKPPLWTKETIMEESIKYESRSEFIKGVKGAYGYAKNRGWLDEVCSHMTLKSGVKKGETSLTKEKIIELVKEYETIGEFIKGLKRGSTKVDYKVTYAYTIARKNGWLDEVCSHMESVTYKNGRPRYIYAIIWEKQKIVYVGLTQSWKTRFNQHRVTKDGVVYRTIQEFGDPEFKVLTKTPVKVEIAGDCEEHWRVKYEEMGYETINRNKTGSLGSYCRMWDYESVRLEALKYDVKNEFKSNSSGAHSMAVKNGWLDDVCSHMELIVGKWNVFENVERESKKYKTRTDFAMGCGSASFGALKNGWMDILYPKENLQIGDFGYWNIKDNILKVAKQFDNISSFSRKYSAAHKSALKNGWMEEIRSLMNSTKRFNGYWNEKKNVIDAISKCKNKTEFNRKYLGAYKSAVRNGWVDELFPKDKMLNPFHRYEDKDNRRTI